MPDTSTTNQHPDPVIAKAIASYRTMTSVDGHTRHQALGVVIASRAWRPDDDLIAIVRAVVELVAAEQAAQLDELLAAAYARTFVTSNLEVQE